MRKRLTEIHYRWTHGLERWEQVACIITIPVWVPLLLLCLLCMAIFVGVVVGFETLAGS